MEIVNREISKIVAYSQNNRKHDDQQVLRIAESIKKFGFNQPLVVDENNEIIVGHGRYYAAQTLGLGHVLSSEVAQHYIDNGFRFVITSNTKSLYKQRQRDKRWRVKRVGRSSRAGKNAIITNTASNKITIGYEFVGGKQ